MGRNKTARKDEAPAVGKGLCSRTVVVMGVVVAVVAIGLGVMSASKMSSANSTGRDGTQQPAAPGKDYAKKRTSDPRSAQMSNVDEKFTQWPSAAAVEADGTHIGLVKHQGVGFALQVQESVAANQTLLSVPYGSALTVGAAVNDEILGPLLKDAHSVALPFLSKGGTKYATYGTWALLTYLLHQRALGSSSFWSPWFEAIVPSESALPPSDLTWSSTVGSKCLNPIERHNWEATIAELGALMKGYNAFAAKNREFSEALGWSSLSSEGKLQRLRWGVYVVRTRGWPRPPPAHMLLVPLIDVVDLRANLNRTDVSHASNEINVAVVFDDEKGKVNLVSVGDKLSKKGTYLTSSYSRPQILQDSLRLYGFVDQQAQKVLTYINFEELLEDAEKKHKEGPADEAYPYAQSLPSTCQRSRELLIDRITGEPSYLLKDCTRRMVLNDGKRAKEVLVQHFETILKALHSENRIEKCRSSLRKGSRGESVDSPLHGAQELVEQEVLLREAFQRGLTYLRDQVVL